MKSFAILYSATSALDYRFIARPGHEDVPKIVSSEFEKNIKGLLSNETPITVPKWIFVKKYLNDIPYVLWGTACQNSALSDDYFNDTKSRSILCFIGVVITYPDERLKLPFDTLSFCPLFTDIMSKVWNSRDSSSRLYPVPIQSLDSAKYIHRSVGDALNYNSSLCRLFPSSYLTIEDLFAEALASNKDISIASGIVSKAEVITPEYIPLLNAVLTKDTLVIKDSPVMRLCCKCNKPSYFLKDGLCEECINDSNNIVVDSPIISKYEPSKLKCSVCGREFDHLNEGQCWNCYRKSKLVHCKKCGKEVEYVYKHGECEACRSWQKRNNRVILIAIVFLICILGISKCMRKPTPTPKPLPKPNTHLMDDEVQKQNIDTLI